MFSLFFSARIKVKCLRAFCDNPTQLPTQSNPILGWGYTVTGLKHHPPPPQPSRIKLTSRQPRAMKFCIQAQLNLLIRVGH